MKRYQQQQQWQQQRQHPQQQLTASCSKTSCAFLAAIRWHSTWKSGVKMTKVSEYWVTRVTSRRLARATVVGNRFCPGISMHISSTSFLSISVEVLGLLVQRVEYVSARVRKHRFRRKGLDRLETTPGEISSHHAVRLFLLAFFAVLRDLIQWCMMTLW